MLAAVLGLPLFAQRYQAQWCIPVRLEVLGGFRPAERRPLSEYFSIIPYRRCTDADWERAVLLAWKLRDNGLTVPWLDVLIAAIVLHDGNRLYAVDAHFQSISEITGLALHAPGHGGTYSEG